MADDQPQQTRVLLLNGQTIILQGDATDNSINEINADLLQQALQEATGGADSAEEQRNDEFQPPAPTSSDPAAPTATGNNLVAIFQGDQGETHTIQLTVEQAEALGLHFMSDEPEKMTITPDLPVNVSTPQVSMASERSQITYTENPSEPEESKPIFDSCINADSNISSIHDSSSLQGVNNPTANNLQQNIGGLTSLSEVGPYIGDSNNITLIPQFVNGQMTYTVKLNEQPANSIQSQNFSVIENNDDNIEIKSNSEQKSKLPLLAPALPSNSLTTPTTTTTSSAPSVSNIRINSIPAMMNTLTPIVPSLTQTTATTATFATQKSLLSPLTTINPVDKTTTKYVVVPTSNTAISSSSALANTCASLGMKSSPLIRTITRPGMALQNMKTSTAIGSSVSTSSLTPSTTSTLTGIPLMNSNINITRTSAAGSSLLQSVSTSLTGGGMIRVVAGGSGTRMVQVPSTNGPKFTNVLTPSGRLVAATTAQPTQQKILTINSTANATKTTTVMSTAASATVTSEPLQSSAVSAVQSTAARLNVNSNKPLGSSENPIQLVQHGQTFHSVQALSQEQLRQIATVLQQQHLDSAPRTKNVLYDAETNTRIIYRVVYPEDLDLREPSEKNQGFLGNARGRGRRGRPPKSAVRPMGRQLQDSSSPNLGRKPGQTVDLDLDEDRLLDDAAKCERKKQVARTRSGRLSRPPRHMVKDYKRLHHLDFADADLDDSDGGYSDYQMSDREVEEQEVSGKLTSASANLQEGGNSGSQDSTVVNPIGATTLLPGLQASKRKISSHFRCPTCQKVYLGHTRMARHFDVFPDHGSIEQMKTNSSPAPSSPTPLPDSTQGKIGIGSTFNGLVRPTGSRRRGKRRGPWAYTTPEARSERRKLKLREALGTCEASELSEVAGPAVAGVVSLWELLLLRVEAVRTEESLMATVCEELRALLEKVQSVAGDVLQPLKSEEEGSKEELFELQDEILCNALGLPSGKYQIVDDHLLSRRAQIGFDLKSEPPTKRLKSGECLEGESKPEETKPSCPEVLSALSLESRPSTVPSLVPDPVPASIMLNVTHSEGSSSQPSSPDKLETNDKSMDTSPEDQDENMKDDAETSQIKTINEQEEEHPFLLPTTSDMCVDELTHEPVGTEGEHHSTETVDDIVNERLKNLTGFSVGVPESEQTQHVANSEPEFQDSHNSTDTVVPTFDPEMALAAMGEGDQPVEGNSLSQYTPEIALAAMGEGEPEPNENNQHRPFNPPIQSAFNSIKDEQEDKSVPEHPVSPNIKQDPSKTNNPTASKLFSEMGLRSMEASHTSSESTKEEEEEIVTFTTSILTSNSENTFITSLAVSSSRTNKSNEQTESSINNFDPEIALAAMGEGDPAEHSAIHPETSFDPEMTLASMGEGVSSGSTVPEYHPQTETTSAEPTFQLTSMDVSLDESGPELDFDTLSAEFTRTARHS